jgi:uncharacterized protein (TIGR02246 family)
LPTSTASAKEVIVKKIVTGLLVSAIVIAALIIGFPAANRTASLARADQGEATRQANEEPIRQAAAELAKALTNGNAKAVAGLFTEKGEYVADDGSKIRGRAAIEKAYAGFLEKSSHPKVEMTIESVYFLSPDSAEIEGEARVHGRHEDRAASSHYSCLYERENGEWRVAQLRESAEESSGLEDIDWLIGDWVAKSGEVEVRTTYSWDDNKKYILSRFTIKENGRTLSGRQRIALDPNADQLRSWLFGDDGDFGEARWSWDGKRWLLNATGVDSDGGELSAMNILTPLSDDAFTWESTNRTLNGADLPDIAPIQVTRVK